MSTAPRRDLLSVEAYLRGEQESQRKHEFVDGIIYAMAGATNRHNRIATNITGVLFSRLRSSPCEVFNSDTKVRVRTGKGTRFYYPDALVACQTNLPEDSYQDRPAIIVEVISEATRRVDESEKRDAYLTIESLQAYVMVEQDFARVTVYRRNPDGFSRQVFIDPAGKIEFPRTNIWLALSDIYENVEFPPAVAESPDHYQQ